MISPTPIERGTPVGKLSDQLSNEKVAQYGIVSHSRNIELNGKVVDIVYAVNTEYSNGEIFFHHELTTHCYETSSQRGH